MNDPVKNWRGEIVDSVLPYAREDERIILLVCDMGFGVADRFKQEFPGRIFNTGMMEQGTVGIAAGMAMTGMVPIVYSIVNFLVFRALEQIRNDVVAQDVNVKFIGTGANDYFQFLGASHCCAQDDKTIMELVGMRVFDPYVNEQTDFQQMVKAWITDTKAGYLRV